MSFKEFLQEASVPEEILNDVVNTLTKVSKWHYFAKNKLLHVDLESFANIHYDLKGIKVSFDTRTQEAKMFMNDYKALEKELKGKYKISLEPMSKEVFVNANEATLYVYKK